MRHHRNMRSQIHPAVGRDQFCHLKDLKPEGLSNRVGESKDSFDVIIFHNSSNFVGSSLTRDLACALMLMGINFFINRFKGDSKGVGRSKHNFDVILFHNSSNSQW